MPLKIVWSETAEFSYLDVIDFIQNKWTNKEAIEFSKKTVQILELISKYPKMYPFSKKGNIRKSFINKQTSL